MVKQTISGAYTLPGTLSTRLLNLALRGAALFPRPVTNFFLRTHRFYQVELSEDDQDSQGLSTNKWDKLGIPESLDGKSVLDVGCAEGLFCLESARRGASRVVGVDARIFPVLSGKLLAKRQQLPVEFRIGVFPRLGIEESFDYVLCLSILHHMVSTKDIWKILTDHAFADDLAILRRSLVVLRGLTAPGGRCLIEIPFQYDAPESRRTVNFERFNAELLTAGFSSSRYLGSWQHSAKNQSKKDRPIYAADA
jgi:SAM-dependent methyltransferase